jgi:hypothetical protein
MPGFVQIQLATYLGGAKAGMKLTLLLCLFGGTVMAQEPKITPLMSKKLIDSPGKEVLMITVEYAPGGSNPIHLHNARALGASACTVTAAITRHTQNLKCSST